MIDSPKHIFGVVLWTGSGADEAKQIAQGFSHGNDASNHK